MPVPVTLCKPTPPGETIRQCPGEVDAPKLCAAIPGSGVAGERAETRSVSAAVSRAARVPGEETEGTRARKRIEAEYFRPGR